MQTNPEKDQDRVFDTVDHFDRFGDVMFQQQRTIYHRLADIIDHDSVLEAGCGNGVGTAILSRQHSVIGTDKLQRNVDFAKCLYQWIPFMTWDIGERPYGSQFAAVVAVEVFEHVANPLVVLQNLIKSAVKEVWISTPNGANKSRPPDNPYHVCEYTPLEMDELVTEAVSLMGLKGRLTIHHWNTWATLSVNTDINPLVYRIKLG